MFTQSTFVPYLVRVKLSATLPCNQCTQVECKFMQSHLNVNIAASYEYKWCNPQLQLNVDCAKASGPEAIKLFSCSTQLSMKFFQLINIKMPTIVGILTFMSGKIAF